MNFALSIKNQLRTTNWSWQTVHDDIVNEYSVDTLLCYILSSSGAVNTTLDQEVMPFFVCFFGYRLKYTAIPKTVFKNSQQWSFNILSPRFI